MWKAAPHAHKQQEANNREAELSHGDARQREKKPKTLTLHENRLAGVTRRSLGKRHELLRAALTR